MVTDTTMWSMVINGYRFNCNFKKDFNWGLTLIKSIKCRHT